MGKTQTRFMMQSFYLVQQTANLLDGFASLNETEQLLLDNCTALLTHLRESHDSPFMNYLRMEHAADYRGTDDSMPDSFNQWLETIDIQEEFDNWLLN